jgi:hypothetical protein
MLVPLLDNKVTVHERAHLAQRLVRSRIENQEQAVAALVASDDPWLKSCGAYAVGALGLRSLEDHLNRCLNNAHASSTVVEAHHCGCLFDLPISGQRGG